MRDRKWFNYFTFDIIGDLSFGESFGCLEADELHFYPAMLARSFRSLVYVQGVIYYHLTALQGLFVPKKLYEGRLRTSQYAADKVEQRLAEGRDRKDFISYIVRGKEEEGLNHHEIHSIMNTLLIAGSETTATLLSVVVFYLALNRKAYDKVVAEVRSSFESEADITMVSVNELSYMLAVLDEGLRIHPPFPSSLPRQVPAAGEDIDGRFVPGGVRIFPLDPSHLFHSSSTRIRLCTFLTFFSSLPPLPLLIPIPLLPPRPPRPLSHLSLLLCLHPTPFSFIPTITSPPPH